MLIMAELCDRAQGWVVPRGPEQTVEVLELAAAEVAPALRLAPVTAKFRVARARSGSRPGCRGRWPRWRAGPSTWVGSSRSMTPPWL